MNDNKIILFILHFKQLSENIEPNVLIAKVVHLGELLHIVLSKLLNNLLPN